MNPPDSNDDPDFDPDHDHNNRNQNDNGPYVLLHIYVNYNLAEGEEEPHESYWGTIPNPLFPGVIEETLFKTWESVVLHYENRSPEGPTLFIHRIFAADVDERELVNAIRRRRPKRS